MTPLEAGAFKFLLWLILGILCGPVSANLILLAVAFRGQAIVRDRSHAKDNCWACMGPDGPYSKLERHAWTFSVVVMVVAIVLGVIAALSGGGE